MHIPDPAELLAAHIDDLAFQQFAGVPDDMVRCFGCQKLIPLNEIETAGPWPNAPAICLECLKAQEG